MLNLTTANTITNLSRSEAHEDARFLSKQTGRHVIARFTECCDDKNCWVCFGEGGYYRMVYELCDHSVYEGEDLECVENNCAEREQARYKVEAA
jgi:hypothetical protein